MRFNIKGRCDGFYTYHGSQYEHGEHGEGTNTGALAVCYSMDSIHRSIPIAASSN